MKKGWFASLLLLTLFTTLAAGCGKQTSAGEPELVEKKLYEFYLGDITNADSIEIIHGGSGERKSFTDKEIVQEWIGRVKDIELVPDPNQEDRTGYLFWVKLFEGKEMKLDFTPHSLDGHYYIDNEDLANEIEELFVSADVKPGMEGYVVKEEGGRILVVDPLPKDFSANGGVKEFYNAIWFSGAPPNVKIGHRVRVWFDMVAESYPGQSRAIKVLILTDNKPRNSDLSEAEAIRKVLQAHETGGFTVVKKAEYDEKSDTWNVVIRQEDTDLNVKVEDKT